MFLSRSLCSIFLISPSQGNKSASTIILVAGISANRAVSAVISVSTIFAGCHLRSVVIHGDGIALVAVCSMKIYAAVAGASVFVTLAVRTYAWLIDESIFILR